MSLPKFSNVGERWDLELRQGSSFGPVRHVLTNPDETPVNLTGCQVRGQIRRKALDTTVVATFVCTIAPDPLLGWYEFALTDEATAAIPCGPTIADALSQFEYDIELEDAAGRVMCTLQGRVSVKPEVTREVAP